MVPVREGGNSNWDGDGEDGELRFKNRLEVELTGAAVTTTAGGERKQKRRIDYVSWVSVAVLLWKKVCWSCQDHEVSLWHGWRAAEEGITRRKGT